MGHELRIVQSTSSLSTFLLAMLICPEVMRRAQTEVDRVVGRSRLPLLSDQVDLPYITAIVKEVLRWRPVAPIGTCLGISAVVSGGC